VLLQIAITAYKKSVSFSGATLFSNYVHSQGAVEVKENKKSLNESQHRKLVYDVTIWQAAAATFSTPVYFPPLKIGIQSKRTMRLTCIQINDDTLIIHRK
jgi:hypothetical protein